MSNSQFELAHTQQHHYNHDVHHNTHSQLQQQQQQQHDSLVGHVDSNLAANSGESHCDTRSISDNSSQHRLDALDVTTSDEAGRAPMQAESAKASANTTTPNNVRLTYNTHQKQVTHRLAVRYGRIKSVYYAHKQAAVVANKTDNGEQLAIISSQPEPLVSEEDPSGALATHTSTAVASPISQYLPTPKLSEILHEIDHYTLDWRLQAMQCLRLIQESHTCTSIIITKLPLVLALGHLVCLGLAQFFDVDQIYSTSRTNKEACIKRIRKRFGATNRCSYIIVGDRDDVELARKLDLPSWTTSRAEGHRQLMQLYTALKEGYLM